MSTIFLNNSLALPRAIPLPATITGRSDLNKTCKASSAPSMCLDAWSILSSTYSSQPSGICAVCIFPGTSIHTGPGRPSCAICMALVNSYGISLAFSIAIEYLQIPSTVLIASRS